MYGIIISMNFEMKAKQFKALSDPTRLRIVAFLADCCCGRAAIREDGLVEDPTAGEVCCHVTGVNRVTSTISHHLHELADAEIITMRRRGKAMLCSLNSEELEGLESFISEIRQGDTTCSIPKSTYR